jgi:hypothetical protein
VTSTSSYYAPYNNGTLQLEVQNVNGPIITILLNGTSIPGVDNISGDVSVGSFGIFPFFIAANLSSPATLYSGAPWTILATTTITVANQSRSVNQGWFNYTAVSSNFSAYAEWDRLTGILVGLNESLFYGVNFSMRMSSTSLWPAKLPKSPGISSLIATTVLITIVGVALTFSITMVYRRRKWTKDIDEQ